MTIPATPIRIGHSNALLSPHKPETPNSQLQKKMESLKNAIESSNSTFITQNLEEIKSLLKNGANPLSSYATSKKKITFLEFGITLKNKALVEIFLDHLLNTLNLSEAIIITSCDIGPFYWAAYLGDLDTIKLIVEKLPSLLFYFAPSDSQKRIPLFFALLRHHLERTNSNSIDFFTLLLNQEIPLSKVEEVYPRYLDVLHKAINLNLYDAALQLLPKLTMINPYLDPSPLKKALGQPNAVNLKELVYALLPTQKTLPNLTDLFSSTQTQNDKKKWMEGCIQDSNTVFEILKDSTTQEDKKIEQIKSHLEDGIFINIEINGKTPLMLAIDHNLAKVTDLLLKYHANPTDGMENFWEKVLENEPLFKRMMQEPKYVSTLFTLKKDTQSIIPIILDKLIERKDKDSIKILLDQEQKTDPKVTPNLMYFLKNSSEEFLKELEKDKSFDSYKNDISTELSLRASLKHVVPPTPEPSSDTQEVLNKLANLSRVKPVSVEPIEQETSLIKIFLIFLLVIVLLALAIILGQRYLKPIELPVLQKATS